MIAASLSVQSFDLFWLTKRNLQQVSSQSAEWTGLSGLNWLKGEFGPVELAMRGF
jgi:hypothetical protein